MRSSNSDNRPVRDYWLSKLFFDLQTPAVAAQYRADPESFFEKYSINEAVRRALRDNDVPFIAERVNPYLLRYYFFTIGMKDDDFMRRLRDG
jgi:hypothetical protein